MVWVWSDELALRLAGTDRTVRERLIRWIDAPVAFRVEDSFDDVSIAQLLGIDPPKARDAAGSAPTMAKSEQCPCGDWPGAGAAQAEIAPKAG